MSTRPGVLSPDDLTIGEQADMATHRVGTLDALIRDCRSLPAGWLPASSRTSEVRYARVPVQDELVSRIGALGDVEYLDN
ncbi:MAG: hypothetical protein JWM15_1720 [Cryptosporangiaceae bacterium]|jgi:hypothetical protein|nr:hypothetical protein [Cryptosporangiaceae bacterium]